MDIDGKTSSIQAMIARDTLWIMITPRSQPDHSNSVMCAFSAQRKRQEHAVRSLRDAGGIRESNNLILLHDAILAMRAHNVTNLSTRRDEEVDSPLR